MDLVAFVAGVTGLIMAIGNIIHQRRQSNLTLQTQSNERELRQQELDSLEHNMVVEIAQKYRDFSQEYDEKIAELKESLEEKEAENNQLKQTNLLYEQRIEFLEESLRTQKAETKRLKQQLLAQNKKLRELESRVKNGSS